VTSESASKKQKRFESTSIDGVKRDTRSGIFYFRDTIHISPTQSIWVDKSLKTSAITVAKARANDIRTKIIRGEATKEELTKKRRTFDELFDIVGTIQEAKGGKTYVSFKTHIGTKERNDKGELKHPGHLRPWFNANCQYLDDFVKRYESVWAEYLLHRDRTTPGRKLRHDRQHLVIALHRATNLGWITRKFTRRDFFLNEAKSSIGKYIEDSSVIQILEKLKKHPKDYLQFLIAVTTGMRRSEILALSLEEIDLENREFNLDPHRIKTRRARGVPVPIPDDVYPLLVDRVKMAKAHGGKYLFPKWYTNEPGQPMNWNQHQEDNRYHWDLIREETGLDIRWHDTRHTAIANMLLAGIPETTVTKVVGATPETVRRIYDKVSKQIKIKISSLFCGRFVK
jgi:integrase